MAKGKFERWLTKEGLSLVEGWARDGLTDEQIASNMGISAATLYRWKDKYCEICEALKRGKEVVDREVENALLKRALGYTFTEKKYEPVKMSDEEYYAKKMLAVNRYKLEHPEATMEDIRVVELGVSRYKSVVMEERVKEVAPDTTAQIFWLKNRKPARWRDKKETELSGGLDVNNPYAGLTTEELRKIARSEKHE
ncbi:helix-turn-helix domain-containing protein [Sporolactobacillus shoreicorticis]|uniref:Transposase n=1 Tax=Sporolactobacillus shoreicorticis TaxID=1923877 RepID=A0ABW5S0T4_9BACL|nr:transposase [Sporolactobacillus shoreicorticis]MCO7128318.1 helix-turn-helix domain-containing protein [Sporolactobacillus shoreicorticis]